MKKMDPIPLRYIGYHDYLGRWVVIDYMENSEGIVVPASENGLTLADIETVAHKRSRIAHPKQWVIMDASVRAAESFAKACKAYGICAARGAIAHPDSVSP